MIAAPRVQFSPEGAGVCLGDQTVLAEHQVPQLCSGQHPAGVVIGQALLSDQHAPSQGGLHPHPEVPLPLGPSTPTPT